MPGRHSRTVVEEVEHLLELILKLLNRGERRYDAVALAVASQAPLLGGLEGPVWEQGYYKIMIKVTQYLIGGYPMRPNIIIGATLLIFGQSLTR